MIIGGRVKVGANDRDIILGVIRVGVLTLGPLNDVLGVADTHNGCPRGGPGAMAAVITRGRSTIVIKPHGMANLMSTSLGHELRGRGRTSVNEARYVGLGRSADAVKRADVSLTARTCGILVGSEDNAHAVIKIPSARTLEAFQSWILGRHIDIKLGKVLGDTAPNILNRGMFCATEGSRIGIKGKGRSREGGLSQSRGRWIIPLRTRRGMTREIEIDFTSSTRPAMQDESLCRRIARGRRNRGDVRSNRGLQAIAHVKWSVAGCRDMQVMIAVAGLDEIFPRNAGNVCRLFTLCDAGEEGRAIGRRGLTS